MTIMQTLNAAARRKYIEDRKLNQVVYSHSEGDVDMVQYSPKGVPGTFSAFTCVLTSEVLIRYVCRRDNARIRLPSSGPG